MLTLKILVKTTWNKDSKQLIVSRIKVSETQSYLTLPITKLTDKCISFRLLWCFLGHFYQHRTEALGGQHYGLELTPIYVKVIRPSLIRFSGSSRSFSTTQEKRMLSIPGHGCLKPSTWAYLRSWAMKDIFFLILEGLWKAVVSGWWPLCL